MNKIDRIEAIADDLRRLCRGRGAVGLRTEPGKLGPSLANALGVGDLSRADPGALEAATITALRAASQTLPLDLRDILLGALGIRQGANADHLSDRLRQLSVSHERSTRTLSRRLHLAQSHLAEGLASRVLKPSPSATAARLNAMNNLGHLLADRIDPPDLEGARLYWTKAASA